MAPHTYPLSATVYIISDVHLVSDCDVIMEKMIDWLNQYGSTADAIYIIGDLFDYWIGDRCIQRYPLFFKALFEQTRRCPIYFMPGNRDFLLSKSLLSQYGVVKIADPTTIQHGTQNYLLTHGDLLCSDDIAYQWLRFFLQNRITIALFNFLPYVIKRYITESLRSQSRQITLSKSALTMSANEATTLALANKYQVSNLIHGHVHCLEQKKIDTSDSTQVFVLDSWEHQVNHCVISSQGIKLTSN